MADIEPQDTPVVDDAVLADPASEDAGPTTEDRARMHGWKNQDEWVAAGRNPDQHTTAEEFLEPAEQRFQLLKANNRDLENKYAKTEKELARVLKFQERNLKMVQDGADQRVKEALFSMDAEQIQDAYAQKTAADKDAEEFKQEQTTPEPTAEAVSWTQKNNSWYGVDRELTDMANRIDRELSAQNPDMSDVQVFAEIDRRLARFLPQDTPSRPAVSRVTPTRRSAGTKKKSGFESLKQDEKDNFGDMVRQKYYDDTADGRKKYYESMKRHDEMKAAGRR